MRLVVLPIGRARPGVGLNGWARTPSRRAASGLPESVRSPSPATRESGVRVGNRRPIAPEGQQAVATRMLQTAKVSRSRQLAPLGTGMVSEQCPGPPWRRTASVSAARFQPFANAGQVARDSPPRDPFDADCAAPSLRDRLVPSGLEPGCRRPEGCGASKPSEHGLRALLSVTSFAARAVLERPSSDVALPGRHASEALAN